MTAPPQPAATGPAALALAATAARRFYLDGASKSEIAVELGLSRFKVARMLDWARSSGLVRIELHYEGEIDLDLSVRLAPSTASALPGHRLPEDDETLLRTNLGRVAAGLLAEIIDRDDVLGLAWSRTLMAMRSALTTLAPCAVVQLTGALWRPTWTKARSNWFVMSLGSPTVRRSALRPHDRARSRHCQIAASSDRSGASHRTFWRADKGDRHDRRLGRRQSTVVDVITEAEYEHHKRLGACAELCGIQLDSEGNTLTTGSASASSGSGRTAASCTRGYRDRVRNPQGSRSQSRRARRFVTSLITHGSLARELLELP